MKENKAKDNSNQLLECIQLDHFVATIHIAKHRTDLIEQYQKKYENDPNVQIVITEDIKKDLASFTNEG